ncbi:MAG TPA: hypothetical protein VH724_03290 [Candidatus Angelobacter sp.]|nr:hypothetical protein [Candidatus Angelobacter sp.]
MLFLLARWFIGPYLQALPIRKAMLVLLSPHIAHHVGLAVLVPGVVGAGFPHNFALVIAIGEPTMLFLLILCMGSLVALGLPSLDIYCCRLCLQFHFRLHGIGSGRYSGRQLARALVCFSLLCAAARSVSHSYINGPA